MKRDNQTLMLHRIKKQDDINGGKWIGVGGKFEEGESAVNRYKEFLKSGGSDYPLNQLKAAGVDMHKKESVDEALSVFADLVDELEKEL